LKQERKKAKEKQTTIHIDAVEQSVHSKPRSKKLHHLKGDEA